MPAPVTGSRVDGYDGSWTFNPFYTQVSFGHARAHAVMVTTALLLFHPAGGG